MNAQTAVTLQQAIALFKVHGGFLRTAQARALGIHGYLLKRLIRNGQVEPISRGLYRLTALSPLNYPEWFITVLRAPKAVLCLESALCYYGLTTVIPAKVHIALPKSVRPPKLAYPTLDVINLSDASYAAGIKQIKLDGISMPIYSPAKTVADCFKFRNKIGVDLAITALRDYLTHVQISSLDDLLKMARINRVENIMTPYITALV